MIQINEVRVGCRLSYGGKLLIVEPVDFLHVDFKKCDPIPLTPEILEKADFGHQWDDFFQHNESRIELCGSVEKGFRLLNGEMATNWDKTYFFLHEIQNLVFILSGQELQIQP